ncbi:hypothetical protein GT347_17105 [Xylophilus rhododendri]|uniref:Pentatricopeptide repeat-containing protein n=1 Tax=Xylophilus rhododendri TaxID=2697032 RepID=A0A857J9W0_9BURK|nr:hypothetical protein [Xylophilus rhododendri]QHI99538.1 hypothetical protein GT347_17105 [Xylophilus rhododendri]
MDLRLNGAAAPPAWPPPERPANGLQALEPESAGLPAGQEALPVATARAAGENELFRPSGTDAGILISHGRQYESARQIFRKMRNFHRGISSHDSLLKFATHRLAMAKSLEETLACLAQLNQAVANPDGVRFQPDTTLFNAIIATSGRFGQTDLAAAAVDDMNRGKCVPDLCTYTSLIHAYGCAHDLAKASFYFREVRQHGRFLGIFPDQQFYFVTLSACRDARQPADALQVLRCMEADGLKPNRRVRALLGRILRMPVAEPPREAPAALSLAPAGSGNR